MTTTELPIEQKDLKIVVPVGPWRPPANSVLTILLAIASAVAGMLAILAAWQLPPFATAVVSTENAYIRGRTMIISPQVSGYISEIKSQDYERVEQGQALFRIDDRVYRQKVAEAQANLDVANANLANNEQLVAERNADIASANAMIESANAQLAKTSADLARANQLVTQGTVSYSTFDTARAAEGSARASLSAAKAGRESARQGLRSAEVNANALQSQVESAMALLELAKIDLGYTIVSAPERGELSDIGARVGQYVTNGTQLVFLVPDTRWVIANYKEAQTAAIRPGQKAWFTVDALDGGRFSGIVERLSPAAGSEFSVLRTDNAIGNFTKIPQRISVRIKIDPGQPDIERLRPGMSVEASVDTSASGGSQE